MSAVIEVNLVGPRLRVRRACSDDAERSYQWFANPEVTKYLPLAGQGCLPMESIRSFLAAAALQDRPELSLGIDLLGGPPIGCGGFRNFENESAELSLVLGDPSTWGKGLGLEAMGLLTTFAFSSLALKNLWLLVREDNARGVRLFERCGFKIVETLQGAVTIEGVPRDKLRMSLEASPALSHHT